jgi:hypothetical protein
MLDTQQMINDFKTFFSLGVVCTTNIHDALELTLGMITEECEGGNDGGGCDVECQFVVEDRELLNEFG